MIYRLTIVLIVAVFAACCLGQARPDPIMAGENIAAASTQHDDIRSYIDDGVYAFKGIPYA